MKSNLPTGWEKVRLGDILTLNYGKSLPKKIRIQGEIPVYSSAGKTGSHNELLVEGPGIIVGRKGTIGTVYYEEGPFCCIDTAYYIEPDSNYDLKYLYYLLSGLGLEKLNSDTAVPGLNRNRAYSVEFNFPPLLEQKVIANTLSCLDDKIELNNKINKNLEDQTQAIFKHWFIDFEFPDENGNPYKSSGGEMIESELGTIPKGYGVLTLDDASILSAGGDKPEIVSEVKTNNCPIPIYSNGISKKGLYGYTNVSKINDESVTVSARGTIGFVCLRSEPFLPIVRLITLIPKIEYISAKYLYFAIKQMNILGTGTTQQQLTVPAFKKSPIIIPLIDIMKKYTDIVNSMFNKIDTNNIENQKLSQIRDTLLPKLMSGELRIPLD